MKRNKRIFCMAVAFLLTVFTFISYLPVKTASAKLIVPKIEFASPPVTQYTVGDRVNFNIHAPNYGGRIQYRVVLWNDSKKTYYDLWNASNGYPNNYYTKWQPYGNNIFTLGWIISEPGSYRITVYAKRAGISNNKTALKGMNCDSYMESAAFVVKSNETVVESILPLSDVTVLQGETPTLPTTVKAAMSDSLIKEFKVTWPSVNTSNPGAQTILGNVEGTAKKASIRVNITAQTAMNVNSILSVNNYNVNVTLKLAIATTPDASKFSIKTYNSSTIIPIQSVNLSADKKTVLLTTNYMATNSWYTLTVNNSDYSFIANQGTGSGISIAAQNKEVAVNAVVYATVTKNPSDVILTYSSSNTTVATVDQTTGLITGKYPGIATITVYGYKYGYSQVTTTFTVTVGGQSGMYAYAANLEIGVGYTQTPSITKYPSDLTLYFTSSNSNIASVNYYTGLVTGVAPGTATITIAANNAGYNTYNSTFTVTVRSQGMTLTAAPSGLYESMANDGSLKSEVIDLTLTGSTFRSLDYYYYYESYVNITNLPYGMSYTAAYVNSNTLRLTLTGKAYSNKDINDATLSIAISKDIVNGASYDLTANSVYLDFTDYPIPDAPTSPVVDNTHDTFGWTNVPGYTSITDYEYRVKNGTTWSSWTPCTAKPQPVGNNNYAAGGVQVRVKAATERNAGYTLASDLAFTSVVNIPEAPINPVIDDYNNTFGWTNVQGFNDVSDYEYSVDSGVSWLDCTTKPQQLYNAGYAIGAVQVRVKAAASPVRPAGKVLVSDKAFTKDTQIDDEAPKLGNIVMTFENSSTETKDLQSGSISLSIPWGSVLNSMTIQVSDANLDTRDVSICQLNASGGIERTWGTLIYNQSSSLWELDVANPSQFFFDVERAIKLRVSFGDTQNNYAIAYININVFMPIKSIADIEITVNQDGTYVLPDTVTALMQDDSSRSVNVSWGSWSPLPLDTSTLGVYTVKGTVSGYTGEVTLTATVAAAPPV